MKKIFTMLLVAAGTISFASAQSYGQKAGTWNDDKKITNDRDEHHAFDKGNSVGYNDSYFSYKEKQEKLERINREFDQKIADVKHSRYLRGWEKQKQIQWLQMQRQNELDKLQHDFAKSNQKAKGKTYGHDSHW